MIRRILGVTAIIALVFVASCGNSRIGDYDNPPPIGFESADGGDAAAFAPDAGLTKYCAVTTCSSPWATCESSKFPCDVDLLNDDENCGACGVRCPGRNGSNGSTWSCIDGQCTFGCIGTWGDCDGDVSNGCEAALTSQYENCGACGHHCPDGLDCIEGKCADPCLHVGFPDKCGYQCANLQSEDANCGTCGNVCDPTGPNLPALGEGMYYGCVQGTCGHAKCTDSYMGNCNGDPSDGCETSLRDSPNCGSCKSECPASKECGLDTRSGSVFRCLCDREEESFCGFAGCRRTDDDPEHCGACNHACPGLTAAHFAATCSFGACGGNCVENHADCDGLAGNGCETNTYVDNRNCGGCGQACLPDQVCSGGKCLVVPCGEEGGTTK